MLIRRLMVVLASAAVALGLPAATAGAAGHHSSHHSSKKHGHHHKHRHVSSLY